MATTIKERSPIRRLTAQKRRGEIVNAAMHESARSVTRAEFENTRRVLALGPGAPDGLLRSPLAQQAMLSMAAALDLLKAWS